MKQYDIGIDLGTTSIIIATEEQGVVFRQPTIGAVDTRTNSILAVGDEALKMVGRAPAHIDLVRPLRDGIIQDHRMTNELIVRFVNQVCRSRIFKPRIAVCVPAAITGIEADAVVESVMAAGARQVYLVDEPVAAALGAGLQIRQPHGCMVVDIGGGSTDIAVISMGGRVKAASLPVAGNAFDSCIAQYVQEKYQIAIGPLTAEQLKKQVACCTRSEFEGVMEVRGHSWETNLPARRIIYTRDLYEPVQELAARIANAARNVLESTPPELAADVSGTGILLTGGGSLLRGLAGYIAGELHTDVAIAPDPLNCVARGNGIAQVVEVGLGHGPRQFGAAVGGAEADDIGNAVDQHGGLAGARARQNQQRALGGKDRLPLHGIEPRKPALNILVAQREIFLGDVSHGVHLSF